MNSISVGTHLHTESIEPGERPTNVLFRAFRRADEDEPTDPVLNDFVDPDALDSLFGGGRPASGVGVVVFEAWDVVVEVSAEEISLYEAEPLLTVDRPTAVGASGADAERAEAGDAEESG